MINCYVHENIRNVSLIMNVLSKICDGQKTLVQDYLREQNGSVLSENIVAEVALFLKKYGKHSFKSKLYFQLTMLLLRTLLEMCVGNIENKKIVFHQGVLETINSVLLVSDSRDIVNSLHLLLSEESGMPVLLRYIQQHLQHTSSSRVYSENSLKNNVDAEFLMKSEALELLKTLIEETSQRSDEFICRVGCGLDRRALSISLMHFYRLLKGEKSMSLSVFKAEQALFRAYHIIVQLGQHSKLEKLYNKKEICHISGMRKLR